MQSCVRRATRSSVYRKKSLGTVGRRHASPLSGCARTGPRTQRTHAEIVCLKERRRENLLQDTITNAKSNKHVHDTGWAKGTP
jgi:hypothetical protein